MALLGVEFFDPNPCAFAAVSPQGDPGSWWTQFADGWLSEASNSADVLVCWRVKRCCGNMWQQNSADVAFLKFRFAESGSVRIDRR